MIRPLKLLFSDLPYQVPCSRSTMLRDERSLQRVWLPELKIRPIGEAFFDHALATLNNNVRFAWTCPWYVMHRGRLSSNDNAAHKRLWMNAFADSAAGGWLYPCENSTRCAQSLPNCLKDSTAMLGTKDLYAMLRPTLEPLSLWFASYLKKRTKKFLSGRIMIKDDYHP